MDDDDDETWISTTLDSIMAMCRDLSQAMIHSRGQGSFLKAMGIQAQKEAEVSDSKHEAQAKTKNDKQQAQDKLQDEQTKKKHGKQEAEAETKNDKRKAEAAGGSSSSNAAKCEAEATKEGDGEFESLFDNGLDVFDPPSEFEGDTKPEPPLVWSEVMQGAEYDFELDVAYRILETFEDREVAEFIHIPADLLFLHLTQ